jgi:hypothetical protein
MTTNDLIKLLELTSRSEPTMTTDLPFKVGAAYLFRLTTHYWTGRVVGISGPFLKLEDAAWIPDTGRYSQAVDEDSLDEIEPREGAVLVNTAQLIDAVEWTTPLPREVK